MASASEKVVTGSVMGTGSAIDVDKIGFKPRVTELFNAQGISLVHQEGMADAAGLKRAANGDGSVVTTNGITPRAAGFRIGTDSVNANGQRIYFICYE